jgi:hypothetical protein
MRVSAHIFLAGAIILALAPAAAQRHDPRFQFCMERARSGRSTTVECRFNTMHQCRMTASGLRARCFRNPHWRASGVVPGRPITICKGAGRGSLESQMIRGEAPGSDLLGR